MSTRDEAVEAMAEAMDTAYSPDRYPIRTANAASRAVSA